MVGFVLLHPSTDLFTCSNDWPPACPVQAPKAPAVQQRSSGLLKGLLTAAVVTVAAGAAVALGAGKKAAPAQERQPAKAWGRK